MIENTCSSYLVDTSLDGVDYIGESIDSVFRVEFQIDYFEVEDIFILLLGEEIRPRSDVSVVLVT